MRPSVLVLASLDLLLLWHVNAIPSTVRYASTGNSTGNEESPEPTPSEEREDEFQENIRRKFAILDLRPKDDCPNNGAFGVRMFYCPTPNPDNLLEWRCVGTDQLCNGIPDCPGAEDEDPTMCMFQLATQEQLRQLRRIIVRQSEAIKTLASSGRSDERLRIDGQLLPSRPASFPFRFRTN